MKTPPYHPFKSAKAKATYLALYDMRAKQWPVASTERTVSTSYGETFVRVNGSTGSPPLVLLHGIGGNSLMWLPNIEALSRHCNTYAVDNIYDCGRSIYTHLIKGPDDFTVWLDELFSALDLGHRINLMGLSYGGWLVSQYALRYPDRLDKIVLLAPAATVLPLRFAFFIRAVLCLLPHPIFTRRFIYWLMNDAVQQGNGAHTLVKEHAVEAYAAIRCFKSKRLVNPTVLDDSQLRSIKVPTLFMVGENENIYSAGKAIQRLEKAAPQIQTAVIPGAGHDLSIAQADMVNQKAVAFLVKP